MTTMSSAEVPEYGLTVLYQPEGRNPSADIIFVHGLQGHPQRTWQSSKDSCSPRAIYWPRDLLSHDRGDARILTYGYDSRISHFFTGPANQMNISQHGEALLNSVAGERLRSKLQGRPIIFVAHSLGGLLVKEALIESKKQQYNPGKTDIYASTQAIVFFGTPHMGSNDVKWGLLVQRIASVAFNTNGKILRGLGVDSELLDRLARDFQDVLDSGKLRVCSFQEAVGKAGLPIFNGKVVPDFSSCFRSRLYEQRDYINQNHMEMCRFSSRTDNGYTQFLNGLAFCMEERSPKAPSEGAKGILKPTEEQDVEATRDNDSLDSLLYDGASSREAQILDADPKTCGWVWEVQASRQSLSKWLSKPQQIAFWIQGRPGSGKSTLMKYIKNNTKTMSYLRSCRDESWVIIHFFFDFRAGRHLSNSMEGLLKSILSQLIKNTPQIGYLLIKHLGIDDWTKSKELYKWNTQSLRTAALVALSQCNANVCVLLDGLDEFEATTIEILGLIAFLKDLVSMSSRIKVCIASRPEPILLNAFADCPGFRMQDFNSQGIHELASLRLRNAASLLDPVYIDFKEIAALIDDVKQRAQGVFIWAAFAIDDLIEGHTEGENLNQLRKRIIKLPEDLRDMYECSLQRLGRKHKDPQATAVMLQLVGYSLKTLRPLEFIEAFNYFTGRPFFEQSHLTCHALLNLIKQIATYTGGLVEVVIESEQHSWDRTNDPHTKAVMKLLTAGRYSDDYTIKQFNSDEPTHAPTQKEVDIDAVRHIWSSCTVRLVHETVKPFLHHSCWFASLQLSHEQYIDPYKMYLEICTGYLAMVLGSEGLRSSNLMTDASEAQRLYGLYPFCHYAIILIFEHAYLFERQLKTSSCGMLQQIMSPELFQLHRAWPSQQWELIEHDLFATENGCRCYYDGRVWNRADTKTLPPLSAAALHGLLFFCKESLCNTDPQVDSEAIACAIAATRTSPSNGREILHTLLSKILWTTDSLTSCGPIVQELEFLVRISNSVLGDTWYNVFATDTLLQKERASEGARKLSLLRRHNDRNFTEPEVKQLDKLILLLQTLGNDRFDLPDVDRSAISEVLAQALPCVANRITVPKSKL